MIFDAHLDLAWNAIDWRRDLEMPIAEMRALEEGMPELGRATNTVNLPEMRRGDVGLCVATVLARLVRSGNPLYGYATPEACSAVAYGQLAYYQAMERGGKLRMIHNRAQLHEQVAAWQADPEHTPIGYVLSMEGADPVLDPDDIHTWYDAGLRAIGLTHYGVNRYAGGTKTTEPLFEQAYPLLRNIERLGIALDMTHLSDEAFWQVCDVFGGRVLASHQNARKYVDDQRQFSDDQLRAVIERDGVIGAALDTWMLQPGWVRGESKPEVTLERVVENIDHVCSLAGNCRHAAIGSDLDGGFGKEQSPADLDTIADLPKIGELLAERGYPDDDIRAILHGNWVRFFGEVLPD